MIAFAGGAIVAQLGLAPEAVFAGLAVIAFRVASAFTAFVGIRRADCVTVTLTLGTSSEMPPVSERLQLYAMINGRLKRRNISQEQGNILAQ